MKKYLWKAVVVQCSVPPVVQKMLIDFKQMTNWLISYGLHSRVHDKMELNSLTTDRFDKRWLPFYMAHYHEAACSFAAQQLSSWKESGGNTSALPYLTKPLARLRSDLFELSLDGNDFMVDVKLLPHNSVSFRGKVFHDKLKKYRDGSIGKLLIFPDGVNIIFREEDKRPKELKKANADTNFDNITVTTEDGMVSKVSLAKIQERRRQERKIRTPSKFSTWNRWLPHLLSLKRVYREFPLLTAVGCP